MPEGAGHLHVSFKMGIAIRLANEIDAIAICGVLRRSIAECCVQDHGNDASLLSAWLKNKTTENVAAWISSSGNFSVVADIEGEVKGFGLLSNTGEVRMCYLLPEVRYIGLGKALLIAMEKEAERMAIEELRLDSTATGLPFYRRNGFRQNGEPKLFLGITAYPCAKRIPANMAVNTESLTATRLP